MNQVVLVGRTPKEVELRYIPQTEKAVANFTMAVDRQTKDKQADFIRVVCFEKTAELCEKHLGKGKLVAVSGSIRTGSYDDKDGKKVYTTEVYANRVQFLEWKDKDETEVKKNYNDVEGFQAVDDDEMPWA